MQILGQDVILESREDLITITKRISQIPASLDEVENMW